MTKLSAAVTVLAVTFGFAVTATRAQPSMLAGGGKDLSGHPSDGKEILIKFSCYGCHSFAAPNTPLRLDPNPLSVTRTLLLGLAQDYGKPAPVPSPGK